MAKKSSNLYTNLAIGILGLVVGLDMLMNWFNNEANKGELIIGIICSVLALFWIIYSLFTRNKES